MRFTCSAALVSAALLASPTFAQPPAAPAQGDTALKGPSVTDRPQAKRKGASTFGPDAIEKKKAASKKPAPPLSMNEFMGALSALKSSSTPPDARLTPEQAAQITAVASEFESSTKAHMDSHKQEIDALRAKLSPNDRNMLDQQLARGGQLRLSKAGFGGKKSVPKNKAKQSDADAKKADAPAPPGAPAPSRDEAASIRARIVEIYAARPKAEDAQAKILGLLTSEQLPLVNAALDKLDARHAPAHGAKGSRGLRRQAPKARRAD